MCFLFKQKTAYKMRISDWGSDVCSSDLLVKHKPYAPVGRWGQAKHGAGRAFQPASEQGLRRLEIVFFPGHEYPRFRALALVQTVDEIPESEGRAAAAVNPQKLDQVGGLGEHEQHAACRPEIGRAHV